MSILIKGINAHRGDCWNCPRLDGEYGDCNVLKKDVHYIIDDECPLIELPDHGDLIDRDELKLCPFCGGNKVGVRTDDNGISWYLFCEDCGLMCGYALTQEDAIEAWNRRVK